MNVEDMLRHVDHTLLKADAKWEDIVKLCDEAVEYKTASVCVPPAYIKRIHETYGEKVNICTVIGFPLGYSVTEAKVAEVKQALADGCNEIDMVINITDVKNGDFEKVEKEIKDYYDADIDIQKVAKVNASYKYTNYSKEGYIDDSTLMPSTEYYIQFDNTWYYGWGLELNSEIIEQEIE